MKEELLKYLICPRTHEPLKLAKAVYGEGGEVRSGELVSTPTGNRYKIIEYIPILLFTDEDKDRYAGWAYQWRSKRFEFNKDKDDIGVERTNITDEFHLEKISMKGKIVCEAGCGGGRLTGVLHRPDVKEFFMVDISEAVFEARAKHKHRAHTHFVMADISHLPFRDDSLDIILNIAVLQHTRKPQDTLHDFARTTKQGGMVLTGHYMKPTNLFVRFKVFYCEMMHKTFRVLHVPASIIMGFTWLSVPAYRYVILRPLAWAFFHKPPGTWSDKVIWQNNFDFYNPGSYQHWNTEREMQQMLLKAGLVPILESRVFPNAYVCVKHI